MHKSQNLDEQFQKAYNYALFLLNIRLRTEGELVEKLKSKKYSLNIIADILKDLKAQHFLDDERFAEIFVQNLKQYKLYGFYKVRIKLLEKRLPKEITDAALQKYFNLADEEVVAKRFIGKHIPLFMTQPKKYSYTDKQKLAAKLQSRGFRSEIISKLVLR